MCVSTENAVTAYRARSAADSVRPAAADRGADTGAAFARRPDERVRATAASWPRTSPGARLVALESENHIVLGDEPAWTVFVGRGRGVPRAGAGRRDRRRRRDQRCCRRASSRCSGSRPTASDNEEHRPDADPQRPHGRAAPAQHLRQARHQREVRPRPPPSPGCSRRPGSSGSRPAAAAPGHANVADGRRTGSSPPPVTFACSAAGRPAPAQRGNCSAHSRCETSSSSSKASASMTT